MKNVITGVLGIVLVIVVLLAVDYAGVLWNGVIFTKKEEIRREIFEETRSFNEAKLQQIAKYKYEYDTGDESTKIAVKSVVRSTFSDYDTSKLPFELKNFIIDCRGF